MYEIITSPVVTNVIKNLVGVEEIEIVKRPASYIIRLKNEVEDKMVRIILLQPKGFTANKINEANSHPESRKARILIKGGVKPGKAGFHILKGVVKLAYFTKRDVPTQENEPYVLIDETNPFYREEVKSSREVFFVVKESGEGFYHNLINLSDEWILLILEKELRIQKKMNIDSKIKYLDESKRKITTELFESITNLGDKMFDENKLLVERVLKLKIHEVMPVLIEGLNIYETGKHEPCTVYAIILKFAKKNPKSVLMYLQDALKNNEAPHYYLKELIGKITKIETTP